jgi:hypothetical protein
MASCTPGESRKTERRVCYSCARCRTSKKNARHLTPRHGKTRSTVFSRVNDWKMDTLDDHGTIMSSGHDEFVLEGPTSLQATRLGHGDNNDGATATATASQLPASPPLPAAYASTNRPVTADTPCRTRRETRSRVGTRASENPSRRCSRVACAVSAVVRIAAS